MNEACGLELLAFAAVATWWSRVRYVLRGLRVPLRRPYLVWVIFWREFERRRVR